MDECRDFMLSTIMSIDLQRKIPQLSANEANQINQSLDSGNCAHTFDFRKIIDVEIIEIVKNIRVFKSSGIPRVSSYLLK